MIKLFIGGFPLDASELDIVKLVGPYVDVQTIKIVRDKKTKICKGYAFLEIASEAGAKQAIDALDGAMLSGRELRLSVVEEKPAGAPPPSYRPKRPRVQRNFSR